ncbi:hypothetical protein DFQ11_1295 [Winogradskyella epiphytica]|uniref:Uncharacterized protein n=1 Tax=Winogradskyella epiphytica TaxID=262005 RepID=A0A2V4WSY0_9FLAO|nr:hypothetical protein [Winogradskyella epiphytica]PYE78496.1 hypothetical protein DFQ11_1295 [Winogradskyella epiphytica]
MKLKLLFVFICIIAISCSVKKEVSRLYGKDYTQILLKMDKTFEYRTYLGVGGEIKRIGTWSQHKGDTILLNTYNQPKNKITSYKGIINPNLKNKVIISIRDFENYLGGTLIEINDGEMSKFANDNGIVEFDTNLIKNISYFYVGTGEKITISNPEFNEIDILIRDLDFEIVPNYFTDMPIVVTNRKVVFYPNDIEKRFERKRANIKNKQWK